MEPCTVLVTGHSLGGALATLCAYDLSMSLPQVSSAPSRRVSAMSAEGSDANDQKGTANAHEEKYNAEKRVGQADNKFRARLGTYPVGSSNLKSYSMSFRDLRTSSFSFRKDNTLKAPARSTPQVSAYFLM